MKKILFFGLVAVMLSCSNKEEVVEQKNTDIKEKTLNDYVSVASQVQIGQIVDAINYGVTVASLERENSNFAKKGGENRDFDYQKAERLAFEYLKIPATIYQDLSNKSLTKRNPSEENASELINLMSNQMMIYNNEIVNVLSVFEDEEREEYWDKKAVIDEILKKYYQIESTIISDSELKEWEKMALLSSIVMAKNLVPSFDEMVTKLEGKNLTRKFWKKLWRGVKNVARATANVVVKTVAVATRTVIHTFGAVAHGIGKMAEDGASGIFAVAIYGSACAVGGALKGFFSGIGKSFNCGRFNFACIVNNQDDETYFCERKRDFNYER